MSANRPRLVLIKGDATPLVVSLPAINDTFEVVEAADLPAACRLAAEHPGSMILGPSGRLIGAMAGLQRANRVVESIGQGVGLVHESREVLWMNAALAGLDPETLRRFADGCAEAIRAFNTHPPSRGFPPSRRVAFRSGGTWYEQVVSPVARDSAADAGGAGSGESPRIDCAVGVVWDVTHSRRLQERIEAVEAAGEELLRLDPDTVSRQNMGERLQSIERLVIHGLQAVLGFEAFEVRMLDRRSGKLELVINVGIRPLSVGESLFASPTGNGISGHVATSGRSYICPDTTHDPLYRQGLDSARSSLTVPLLLQERVIGVMNVESASAQRFDEGDRQLAELYGRYLAQGLNTFELLLRERVATREQFCKMVSGEISAPLEEISRQVQAMRESHKGDSGVLQEMDRIVEAVATVRGRLEACSTGPQTLLGVEEALANGQIDPLIANRRILVADDEPVIRQTVLAVLEKRGAAVTICRDGGAAIEAIAAAAKEGKPFDLIISDVRMPDRNGYEVFRAAKEAFALTPVILMTGFGYDPHHSIVRSSQEGLHCFLFKPFQVSQLMDEVKKAMTEYLARGEGL